MLRVILCLLLSHIWFLVQGQEDAMLSKDSTKFLKEVSIQAYEYGKPIREVPAAVALIKSKDFERFNNTSLLPALNTIPGVRMEERSPGSYRLSIRGSTLRSPFGVRNVKVYWNDLPFTDPGGNTYLNLLDINAVLQAEIIKGPGASLYGAGTGGVLLLKNTITDFNQNKLQCSASGGSYGLQRYTVGIQRSSENQNLKIQYAHQQADGYREQSGMNRDALQIQGSFRIDNKRVLSGNIFYAHLNYQTPGGLTKAQFEQNPKQARPAGGPFASAVEQHAAVDNKTLYAGLSQEYEWNSHWSNRTGFYGTFTQFENPAIRNFERRREPSFGGRSMTQYTGEKFKLNVGVEFQHGISRIKLYDNNKGIAGALQTDDKITSNTAFIFAQTDFTLPLDFYLTIGGSLNFSKIVDKRLSATAEDQNRNFMPVVSPRLALLKKINSSISMYGSFSQGFSPPSVAEIYPSTAVFDNTLNPERGNNYEVGIRGALWKEILNFDLTAYSFQLKDAITLRRNADGADYYVNSGANSQKGLELSLAWTPHLEVSSFVQDFKLWTSGTMTHYFFKNYYKDTINLSGNKLTGAAPYIAVVGLDISLKPGLYCNLTFNYTDRIPLDDANTAFANSYALLGGRAGYRASLNKLSIDFFGGVDNAFDEHYSLGNDLNAQGQRYFNAAAGRNYFVGLKVNLITVRNR